MANHKFVQCGMMDRRMAGCVCIELQLSAYSLLCCQSSKVSKPAIWCSNIVVKVVDVRSIVRKTAWCNVPSASKEDDSFSCWEWDEEKGLSVD